MPSADRKVLDQIVRHHLNSIDDPLTPLVDAYYIKRKKRPDLRIQKLELDLHENVRPGGRLSPSSIGGCQRQAAFRFLGVDGVSRTNPDTEAIFENGHWVHRKWQTIFRDMEAVLGKKKFRCNEIEGKIRIPKLFIAGALDADVSFPRPKKGWFSIIIDVKSINARGWGAITKTGMPIAAHVEQVTTYGKAAKARYVALLYENKDTNEYQVFVIEIEKGTWLRVKRWCAETLAFMEDKKLPPMHPECSAGNFLYEKCPYRNLCFGSQSERRIQRDVYEDFEGLEPLWIRGLKEEADGQVDAA